MAISVPPESPDKPKRPDRRSTAPKDFPDGPDLTLSQLEKLGSQLDERGIENNTSHKLYQEALESWGILLQSPVNKLAQTLHQSKPNAFRLNEWGALMDTDTSEDAFLTRAQNAFFDWLGGDVRDPDIERWLTTGKPLAEEKVAIIKKRLREKTLTNDSLYNKPICRLVHGDQLRRDLDYHVIYQLTPGQLRLIGPRDNKSPSAPSLQDVRRNLLTNQRVYWGISETFQSLLAMFDSDLGSRELPKGRPKSTTKELIRITAEDSGSLLAPDELNKSSPLRFWSPPPAFAGSVFHMLFWRSVITGTDLFGRQVIKSGGRSGTTKSSTKVPDDPSHRARQYYVIINSFNAAKFRLANYERLFEALMTIARTVGKRSGETSLRKIKGDMRLPEEPRGLLYPDYFPHSQVQFPEFKKVGLALPFGLLQKSFWELPWEHQTDKKKPTQVSDLLKFLRNKALELIIWSKYQMEIRSVGLIPIRFLYHVELTAKGKRRLEKLSAEWKKGKRKKTPDARAKHFENEINAPLFAAIVGGEIDSWVNLRMVYGGTYRTIFDEQSWRAIKRLESPRLRRSPNTSPAKNPRSKGVKRKPVLSTRRER